MRTQFQYMSDLHLERIKYDFSVPKKAPFLILGGDIGRFCDSEAYMDFMRAQCGQFDKVFLIAGNHEFYGSSRETGLSAAATIAENPDLQGRLVFMNRTRYDLPHTDITVLGCTLQSRIGPDCGRLTRDFARIQDWSVQKHNAEHTLDVDWLQQELQQMAQTRPDRRVILVTHHAPAFERTCHPKNENNAASPCFCSDVLSQFPAWEGSAQVTHWLFGHTHWNARIKVGRTRVLSNQLCNDSNNLTWWQRHTIYRPFDATAIISV